MVPANEIHHRPSSSFDVSGSSAITRIDAPESGIENLARQVTNASRGHNSTADHDVLNPPKDSPLDPSSPAFSPAAWAKAFINLYESDPKSAPNRVTGVAFRNLNVFGYSTGTQYQKSAGNIALSMASDFVGLAIGRAKRPIDILRDFEGLVEPREMLLVLGPPGSGCSTLLKTLAGQTEGLNVAKESHINFRGIDPKHMHNRFRGDVLYNAEVDVHLAPLTVGDTLEFAARARVPSNLPAGLTDNQYTRIMRDTMMAAFGISHTVNTKVGDDFVRGVSGGERKRVSIVEAALTGAKFQCWDNSTRGLDSGNAIKFCENLRTQSDLCDVAAVVAIYQAPQSAYDLFDKVTVLYEGRQIFFGKIHQAKEYFENLGFQCPDRQTTPDFLTSMTSPSERRIKPGYEHLAPRTPDEFAASWKSSLYRAALMADIVAYEKQHPAQERLEEFQKSIKAERSPLQRLKSPYMISYPRQVRLCLWRGWKRLLADPGFTLSSLVYNIIVGLVLGSMFLNLKQDSSTFYYRAGLIFFALLFNAFASEMEVLTLYSQRPVVEKHNRYAFYHQSAEAISSYIMELPYKITNVFTFNSILYFMANLRREPGPFFFFCLVSFMVLLAMSGIYRTIASLSRTSHQAMVPVTLLTMGVMMYAGFTVPTSYMLPWSRWMGFLNPLSYAFEALMANEFHDRKFLCAGLVPSGSGYNGLPLAGRTCAVVGAVPGSNMVDGDRYIEESFGYSNSHKWRDVGILIAYIVFFFIAYIVTAEFAKPPKSEGEVLVFRRGRVPTARLSGKARLDEENYARDADVTEKAVSSPMEKGNREQRLSPSACGKPIFHWEDICYDINIKGQDRRILDHVDGWVQPGVITALMGASGAGKTTLLDSLANRVTMGVLSGATMVNGQPTDRSFPHRVGYVQQQDVHMETMTVREALEFSALLRQSADIPREEKLAYIDKVIDLLDMGDFVDAVIGVPGQGLNVEQRKRLTIGVELAARPQLLVFLDEPTSGLDSQTSWAICDLIEKLAKSGQAILCTIHQPSAMLFSRFDRLLLLQRGGKTVYFGDIGANSRTMIRYLERNGAPTCPPDANPAEWMLDVTAPSEGGPNWFDIWHSSVEYREVKKELGLLRQLSASRSSTEAGAEHEFVTSFWTQFGHVLVRTAKHFWRSPVYIWSKLTLTVLLALFIGFTFKSDNSLQGLQNQLYAFFMCLTTVNEFSKQIMPMFVPQRALYEVRERPSRVYRWTTYILSNIVVEMIWNTFAAVIFFFCWYYPARFFRNTTPDDVTSRGFTVFLFIWMFFLWMSTFSQLAIVAIETADLATIPASLFAILCMSFCGVGVVRADLPAIWSDFMYFVSPMTYLASGTLSTCLHGSKVVCTDKEIVRVPVPSNMTCGAFLGPFVQEAGGYLVDAAATDSCGYCRMRTTDDYLAHFDIKYGDRWRNFGILWIYIAFNVIAVCGLYWLVRVPKGQGVKRKA